MHVHQQESVLKVRILDIKNKGSEIAPDKRFNGNCVWFKAALDF